MADDVAVVAPCFVFSHPAAATVLVFSHPAVAIPVVLRYASLSFNLPRPSDETATAFVHPDEIEDAGAEDYSMR